MSYSDRLDRVFNPYVLLFINIGIICATEIVGRGHAFFDYGIIHGIAILFILLAMSRVFDRYYLSDPQLKTFFFYNILALVAFAASHFIEFISFRVFGEYEDIGFANVVNMYCISILFVLIGAEVVIAAHKGKRPGHAWIPWTAIAGFVALTALFLTKTIAISLEPDEFAPYVYGAVVVALTVVAYVRVRRIGRFMPMLRPFTDEMLASVGLTLVATLPNAFYEGLEKNAGIDKLQIIYVSHFTFYAALSLFYLAFKRFKGFGGVYKDVREAIQGGGEAADKA